jgi:hypothetical protein
VRTGAVWRPIPASGRRRQPKPRFGNQGFCYVAEEDVARAQSKRHHTRPVLNPKNMDVGQQHLRDVQRAARSLGQQIQVLNAANEEEIDSAFAAMAREARRAAA